MRIGELLGAKVTDPSGRSVGDVVDLRFTQDGPRTGHRPALRLDAVLVSPHHTGRLMGYGEGRPGPDGPWLIKRFVRFLHRGTVVARWDQVASLAAGHVTLAVPVESLPRLPDSD